MKNVFYSLFLLFISFQLQSQEIEKLPKIPWEEIVEVNNNELYKIARWNTDVYIQLEGNYNKQDSLEVARVIKKLDSITETITIKFATDNNANYKIHYLDKYQYSKYDPNRELTNSISKGYQGNIRKVDVRLYLVDQTNAEIRKTLEYNIANCLVFGHFPSYMSLKRNSIFHAYNNKKNKNKPLNSRDLEIIKEIYKKGFKKRLKKAEIQFRENTIKNLEKYKIDLKHKNLWWVRNPIAVILIPTLVLFLFFLFFTSKIKNYINRTLNNNFLKFLLVSLIAVCFIDILIIFSISFYDYLSTPPSFRFSIIRFDTVFSTFVFSCICFPFLFLFRFLEKKIEKAHIDIITKTSLIFLSTGFLPFIIILVIAVLSLREGKNYQGTYTTLSYVFIASMIIASIRALISYFIFKERNLIVENEKQLSNLRELKAQAELKSLQSQINPHFLYNSLNSIASLAPIDADKTQKMAHSLSDLFKYSINRKGKKMSTVKDEIEMVKSYLDIEKIRFGDRLQFDIEVRKEIQNYQIPLFLIQPLIENAVKHGISQNEGKGKIILKIEKSAYELIISVSDNGPDFPEGLVSGHGLQTVYDLLRLSYGENASLNWANSPQKIITITILETP
ncbi:sensor histidine kinase [Polaribacter sp. R77954]|uniref:sensor histidine kinase n=1 Tax=Polaribacter sp. R77954 TaxID=3093870 RepID=UPI0037C6F461